MEERPLSDRSYELLPSAKPATFDFRIARPLQNLAAGGGIAPGTAWTSAELPFRPDLGPSFDSHVAAHLEPAADGWAWQNFVHALPTTPNITEGVDPIFGKVYFHTYLDLVSNPTPERGDAFSYGAASVTKTTGETVTKTTGATVTTTGSRIVRDVQTQDLGQGLQRVIVTTAASAQVTIEEKPVDPETGRVGLDRKTYTITATAPVAAAVGSDGTFTEVTRPEHNLWLARTQLATTLPQSRATAITWQTTGKIPWPAVLESYEFTSVVAQSLDHFVRLLSYNLRDPYYGDVPVTVRRWWQATPYTFDVPTDMVASAIHVAGNLMSIAIPEALHGGFVYQEENFTAAPGPLSLTGAEHSIITWTFGATNQTDWPESIAKVDQQQSNGGFIIEERTYARPAHYNTSQHTVSKSAWHEQFGVWYAP